MNKRDLQHFAACLTLLIKPFGNPSWGLPPLMTSAEAFASASMDTPLMMLSGYTVPAGMLPGPVLTFVPLASGGRLSDASPFLIRRSDL